MPPLRAPSLLLAAALPLLPQAVAAQPPSDHLTEEITVFEAQATLDASDLGFRDRQRLRPSQLLVIEGGLPRKVTNLQPLGSGGWRLLIYVDAPLARERTVRLAALRLGALSQKLTELGPVELVVADPEPRTVFGPSDQSLPLAEALKSLSAAEVGDDQVGALRKSFAELGDALSADDPRREEALLREETLVRERADRLLLQAARGCDGDPCALFVVSDGFYHDPAAFYLGPSRLSDQANVTPAGAAARDLAQTVAAYEWIAFPLPLREERLQSELVARTSSDFEVFLDHTGAVQPAPKRSDREPKLDLESLEVSVAPLLQPLAQLAVASSGKVVRIADDLAAPLEELPERRRVYYLTDRPVDGDLRELSARIAGSSVALRTPEWVRSSTPAPVAAARLRALLAGAGAAGSVPVRVTVERDREGRATLRLDATWSDAAELMARSPIRVSVAYPLPGTLPWVGHQLVPAAAVGEDGGWTHRLTLPVPAEAKRLAVLVEALVPRSWGAAVTGP